jgi:hypothetical protein
MLRDRNRMLLRSRTFLFRVALAALFAMLATALMPTASQLVRKSTGAGGSSQHCIDLATTGTTDQSNPSAHNRLVACGFCTLYVDHPAALPSLAPLASHTTVEREPGRAPVYRSPLRQIAWSSAFTRAPPAAS